MKFSDRVERPLRLSTLMAWGLGTYSKWQVWIGTYVECPGGDVHAHHLEDGVEGLDRDGAALVRVELLKRPLQGAQLQRGE